MTRDLLLVAEDPTDAALVTRALNGGWRVVWVTSLQAALASARPQEGWSAVITDLCLPDVPIDVRTRIVEHLSAMVGSDVPVLALTDTLGRGERLALLRAGAWWVGRKGGRPGDDEGPSGEEEAAVYALLGVERAMAHRNARDAAHAAGHAAGLVEGRASVAGLVDAVRADVAALHAQVVRAPWWARIGQWVLTGWQALAPTTRRRLFQTLTGFLTTSMVTAPWWLRWLWPFVLELGGPVPFQEPPPALPVVVREEER